MKKYKKVIIGWKLINPADRECSPEEPIFEFVEIKDRKKKKK